MARDDGPHPNVDFALGVLGETTRMVPGAGETVFAVARSAGWIAHGLEEYPHRLRYRIRATYTGPERGCVASTCMTRDCNATSRGRVSWRDGVAAVVEEVDQHVVTEGVGVGEEGATTVDVHHALDERPQVVGLVEHERVDADAVARAAHDLLQRLLDRDR